MIFAVLAMVASSFINEQAPANAKDHLASAKTRIEQAGQVYAQSKLYDTVLVKRADLKPTEG